MRVKAAGSHDRGGYDGGGYYGCGHYDGGGNHYDGCGYDGGGRRGDYDGSHDARSDRVDRNDDGSYNDGSHGGYGA